ncbi:Outer membrane protein HopG, putative signal peptide [Helicobacter cetorum MIT 00-7128]|uniref:Outer membrane protein HopG, putative signal peptide n=1 Tax=Helicobacter cetorum (strain ATCC BAA-429 / MIT 00-7128) TaxID=182217 RepID=I0EPE8_HELC0|nr:Outer membrane protein HopG, putative signal peptide [Helicobacter cetorum MIT 00-7128]
MNRKNKKNMFKNFAFKATLALSVPLCAILAEDSGFYMGIGYQIGGTQQQIDNKGSALRQETVQSFRNVGVSMAGNQGLLSITTNAVMGALTDMVSKAYPDSAGGLAKFVMQRAEADRSLYTIQGLQKFLAGLLKSAPSTDFSYTHTYQPAIGIFNAVQQEFGQLVVGSINILNRLNLVNNQNTSQQLGSLLSGLQDFYNTSFSTIPLALKSSYAQTLGLYSYQLMGSLGKTDTTNSFLKPVSSSEQVIVNLNPQTWEPIPNTGQNITFAQQLMDDIYGVTSLICATSQTCDVSTTKTNPFTINNLSSKPLVITALKKLQTDVTKAQNDVKEALEAPNAQANLGAVALANMLNQLQDITTGTLNANTIYPVANELNDLYNIISKAETDNKNVGSQITTAVEKINGYLNTSNSADTEIIKALKSLPYANPNATPQTPPQKSSAIETTEVTKPADSGSSSQTCNNMYYYIQGVVKTLQTDASNSSASDNTAMATALKDALNLLTSKTSNIQAFTENLQQLLGVPVQQASEAIFGALGTYKNDLNRLSSMLSRYDEPYLPQFVAGKSSQHGVSNGLGIQMGYKQFFGRSKNVGFRYYGFFDYGYTQLGILNTEVNANIFTYGVGTDFLWNIFRRTFLDKALNMGVYGGIQIAGNTWDSSLYHQIKTNFDSPKHLNPTNFQFLFNLGLRANFARATHYRFLQFKNHTQIIQHGVEFGVKIPAINQAYLRSAGADVTYRRLYIFYVNYNIGF